MIAVYDLVQQYAGRVVLDIPELHFEPGRRYGIIGENGSGKTTLIRLLGGTIKATSGRIEGFEGKKLGYLPQSPYAFSFSVLENVALALDGQSDAKQLAQKALESVGMENLLKAQTGFREGKLSEWLWQGCWCVLMTFSCWMSRRPPRTCAAWT